MLRSVRSCFTTKCNSQAPDSCKHLKCLSLLLSLTPRTVSAPTSRNSAASLEDRIKREVLLLGLEDCFEVSPYELERARIYDLAAATPSGFAFATTCTTLHVSERYICAPVSVPDANAFATAATILCSRVCVRLVGSTCSSSPTLKSGVRPVNCCEQLVEDI